MSTFRFLHAADIHLDSPLRGLEAYPGAPVELLRSATREAFRALTDYAISEEVAFLVIAGDLYDGDWRDFNTGLLFAAEAARLARAGIDVILLRGNHDAESQITKVLTLPSNVRLFSARNAETIVLDACGVALHGRSFARRDVTENMAAAYPDPVAGLVNIGVLHTALEGSAEHAAYAPCTLAELLARGYDYWALGHVHQRCVLHEDPYVVFAGNLQGRCIRETGPKGATLVTCEDGRITDVEAVEFDVVRWALIECNVTGCGDETAVLALVRRQVEEVAAHCSMPLAARVRIIGTTAAHGALLRREEEFRADVRAVSLEIGADRVWVEKIQLATTPVADLKTMKARGDAVGELQRILDEASREVELQALVRDSFAAMLARLPAELRSASEDPVVSALREGRMADVITEIAGSLTARLLAAEE
jgi:exonuclease SbcD